MTKLELIENLALRFKQVKPKHIKEIVYTTFDSITQSLEDGDRVEVRGFGSFSLHYREARRGRNPKTGENVQVAGKLTPHFRVGKEMRQRINESSKTTPIKD